MAYTPNPDDELDFGEIADALAEAARGDEAQPEPNATLKPGLVLDGRFKIEGFIDSGGMGQIYRAIDTAIDANVALKLVRVSDQFKDATERDRRVRRVMREVSAAREASQRCGHILNIHDIRSLPSGDPYIVMELLEGENLRDWIDIHAPANWTIVRDIATQLAAALKALHRPGFIHRDIKPANIFALEGEHEAPFIKLIDFGIVKDLEAAAMTATAASLGTMRYMSPEAFSRTERITDRSDIFGVGLVLYEALCGVNPMPLEHNALIEIYSRGVPLVSTQRTEETPAWFRQLIDRCLQLRPADRPSAAELYAALQRADVESSSTPDLQHLAVDVVEEPEARPVLGPTTEPSQDDLRDALSVAAALPAPAPAEPAEQPADAEPERLSTPFDDQVQTYQLGHRPKQRSSVPMALAVFAGFCVLALALILMQTPEDSEPSPQFAVASEPKLDFRPTGPVSPDDFPTARRSTTPSAPVSAPVSASVATRTPATSVATVAPTPAAKRVDLRRPPERRRPSRRSRTGVSKSFAEIRDSALRNAGAAPTSSVLTSPAPGTYVGAVEYGDDGDDGAQFFNKPKPEPKTVTLPVGGKLKARLVSGISSSKHATVVARLTRDVVVNGAVVLAKGDVIKGRSSNDSQRVFVDFRQGIHAGEPLKFTGHAVTNALPGLPATKKTIPTEERGSNAIARGALTTAGGVAATLSGGVAGDLASDVAREGVSEARPDFRERQPFVLTVPEGVRFDVIVTGS